MAWPKLQIIVHATSAEGHILCGTRKRSPRGPSLTATKDWAGVTCKKCLKWKKHLTTEPTGGIIDVEVTDGRTR